MKTKEIKIGNITIGGNAPCFMVAEAGANHDGDFNKAKELIDAAADTKAESIKFQHYSAGKLTSKEAKRYWYVHGDEKGFQFDPTYYKDDQKSTFEKIDGIPRDKDAELIAYGAQKNIVVFSTPFDFESVDHLESIGAPLYKIASGDITYHDFLRYVASKGKPIMLSTGAANLDEIKAAVNVIKEAGNDQIILLHCTLAYPTPLENANLLMMQDLHKHFPDLPIGLSDHTPGIKADVAAAMLGAAMIEKHFTHTPGHAVGDEKVGDSPDHDIGIGPTAFKEMISRIKENEKIGKSTRHGMSFESAIEEIKKTVPEALGSHGIKEVDEEVERKARLQARRSLVANTRLVKGEIITKETLAEKITVKRPGTGIEPYRKEELIGKKVKEDIEVDTVLKWTHLV